MKWVLALCLAAPIAAFAEHLPALFDVVDVDASDVLNIRQGPDATTAMLGTLAHDAANVEIVALSDNQNWGLVNTGERSGWVSMAFLRRAAGATNGPLELPLRCFGTEPFWTVDLPVTGSISFAFPNNEPVHLELEAPATAHGRSDKFGFLAANPDVGIAGAVTRTQCGDGMSDRTFGLTIDLLAFPNNGQGTLLSGCCSLGN